ncbi:MAG TPA: DUF2959 domain-containing protein [Tepidisphaeraceae bacterium]|nr:DUF2959 domain-containing protein [Tepidisphaeraceae bacterium]
MTRIPLSILALIIAFLVPGCATTRKVYYDAWEKLGYAKRERLVDNVKEARQEQVEAKQQFASALEEFKSVVNFKGGDLEKMYNKLNDAYRDAESQANEVTEKITGVKRVADALFTEWKGEIAEIREASLQQSSQKLYIQTRDNYRQMIQRMDAAAATMDPVLQRFKDRVLFIKSNLNAQAIASLSGTEVELGEDIERLIREMEASIAEADRFIAETQAKK